MSNSKSHCLMARKLVEQVCKFADSPAWKTTLLILSTPELHSFIDVD